MRVYYQKLRNIAHTIFLGMFSLFPKDVTFMFYSQEIFYASTYFTPSFFATKHYIITYEMRLHIRLYKLIDTKRQ